MDWNTMGNPFVGIPQSADQREELPANWGRTIEPLVRTMTERGFQLPYERMRQSQNMTEYGPNDLQSYGASIVNQLIAPFRPGMSTSYKQNAQVPRGDDPLAQAAGYSDIKSPYEREMSTFQRIKQKK